MNTIKLGSKGPDVGKWQGIIGVKVDNDFGPATQAATVSWQRQHKLVADGIVGPATWNAALGTKADKPTVKTPGYVADNKAYQTAVNANKNLKLGLSDREIQYVVNDARGEGFYGGGWGAISKDAAAHGLRGDEGVGSNNWGAVQGTGSGGSFPHIDYHADGSAYVGRYKRYNTPEEGFADMAKVILGGGIRKAAGAAEIRAAINKGSMREAVMAQHANGYFELAPEKYLSAMLHNYDILTVNNEWKPLLSEKGGGIFSKILSAIGIAAAAVAGGYILSRTLRG
jgi:hypothetical protein